MSSLSLEPLVAGEPWPRPAQPHKPGTGTGRSFVTLPTAGDREARGSVLETRHGLVRIGPVGRGRDELWELPVVWLATATSAVPHVQLELFVDGVRSKVTVTIPAPPPAPPATEDPAPDEADQRQPSALDSIIDRHVEAVRHWLDGSEQEHARLVRRAASLTLLPLHEFCTRYWELENQVDAPLSLIVRIANDAADLIEQLATAPRRILRRDRQQVPLGRAQQLDASCLRWLTRQPGRTTAQRAGPRQMVRAVVREPSIDTLENRVLRHFLVLCRREANHYLRKHQGYRGSPRVRDVVALRSRVDRLLRHTPIGSVGSILQIPEPNYVLQFDERYSVLWHWYLRLIRQEQERDDLRVWHQRVWSERCKTAVLATLETLSTRHASFRGQLALQGEAVAGQFYTPISSHGPWVVGRTNAQFVVRMLDRDSVLRQASLTPLQTLAFDYVLAMQDPFDETRIRAAVAVFSLFVPDDDDTQCAARLERLDKQLPRPSGDMTLGAIVFTPHRPGTKALQQSTSLNIVSCRLPLPESQDRSAGWKALERCIMGFAQPGGR